MGSIYGRTEVKVKLFGATPVIASGAKQSSAELVAGAGLDCRVAAAKAAVHPRIGAFVLLDDMALGEDRVALGQRVVELGDHRRAVVTRGQLARGIAFEDAAYLGGAEAVLDAEALDREAALAGRLEQPF